MTEPPAGPTAPEEVWKLQEDILEPSDIEELVDFIRTTTRFTQFVKVREFEEAWSRWQGCRYSVFFNSGSSANLVMLNLLKQERGWSDGDEVIVPAITWVTNITPVMHCGLTPVFADVNLDDFSFDYDALERAIGPRTRAIFVTHLLGFPAHMARISAIAARRDLAVLEDSCESHGAVVGGRKVGNHGLLSSFSFYWGHHMTTVEGGMLCTDREELYHLALLKRSHGLARELPQAQHAAHAAAHPDIDFSFLFLTDGFNLRNTELHAVLGLAQLRKLDAYISRRNENHRAFLEILSGYPEQFLLPDHTGISSFCLPMILRDGAAKARLQEHLRAHRIEFRPFIGGNLLRQPAFARFGEARRFPNAEFLNANAFYIGNNQFVGPERLARLRPLLKEAFGTR